LNRTIDSVGNMFGTTQRGPVKLNVDSLNRTILLEINTRTAAKIDKADNSGGCNNNDQCDFPLAFHRRFAFLCSCPLPLTRQSLPHVFISSRQTK
jgi:hypothetical protein